MLGARSTLEIAVGSRPKLKTTSTSTTKTAAERIAVRERNSTSRSLEATAQAWRRSLGDRIAVVLAHLLGTAPGAGGKLHESPGAHERDVRGEPRPFLHVVRHQNARATGRGMLGEQTAEGFGGNAIEAGKWLVEQQHRRIVDQGTGNRDPLHESARQRPHGAVHIDRKSTRLNSSHMSISYAVFC